MNQFPIPEGFKPHSMSAEHEKFLTMLGPWFYKDIAQENGKTEKIFGIHIEDKHTNIWGLAHGALDLEIGYIQRPIVIKLVQK